MKKARRRKPQPRAVRVELAVVKQAIAALDATEQLLELLRGILNGGDDFYGDDLLRELMDRVIVSARVQLAMALPSESDGTFHHKAGPR